MASARTTRIVYLPSDPASAQAFRRSGVLEQARGVAVDEAYARARDLDLTVGDDEEEADYWALADAALQSLVARTDGPRMVIAARVGPDQLRSYGPDGSGLVTAEEVAWSQVSALFIDDGEALESVHAARAAREDPERFGTLVEALVAEHDLLWYAPEELDQLVG